MLDGRVRLKYRRKDEGKDAKKEEGKRGMLA